MPKLTPRDFSCVGESSGTPKTANGKRFAPDLGKSRKRSRRSTKTVSNNAQRPTKAMQQVGGSSVASASNVLDSTQVQHLIHEREPIRHISPQHSAPSYVRTESSSTGPGGRTGPGDVTSQVNRPLPLPEPGNADAWAGSPLMWNIMDEQPLLQPGNIDAWAGSPALWDLMHEQTLPLPQPGNTDAWAESSAMGNAMHEQTLSLSGHEKGTQE